MSSSEEAKLRTPVSQNDHQQGPANAPVVLVEYGDYECPYCGKAYPIVKRIQSAMGDELCFVFRNFPLTTVHPDAEKAAEAAESAAAQGKFWEMHDALYEHQNDLSIDGLLRIGQSVGIDTQTLQSDLKKGTYEDRVYADFMSGVRSGVNGTPTFFVNGERYDGDWDYEPFVHVLQKIASQSK